MKRQSGIPLFVCQSCSKTFTKKYNLIRHTEHVHATPEEAPRFICNECGKTFKRRDRLIIHFRSHTPESYRLFTCQICDKSFNLKYGLDRHMQIHVTENEQIFSCNECNKSFAAKRSLASHIRTHIERSNQLECKICHKLLSGENGLRKHVRKRHELLSNEGCSKSYECSECSLKVSSKFCLNRHIRTFHSQEDEKHSSRKAQQFKCLRCHMIFPHRSILVKHYQEAHNIEVEFEYLQFPSIDEFAKWLSPCYIAATKWETAAHVVKRFHCHRSGVYEDQCKKKNKKRERQLKVAGSKKLNGYCPAEVVLRQRRKDGVCYVVHQKAHVKHDINSSKELRHVYLTKEQKEMIACQVLMGVPRETILKKTNQNSNTEEHISRLDILNVQDIKNVTSVFCASDPFSNDTDPAYVNEFVSKHRDSILFYKKHNEEDAYNILQKDDFLIVFQDQFQKKLLMNYGHKFVIFESIHESSQGNFVFHSMLVLDNDNQIIPVGFLISNRNDETVFNIFLQHIKDCVGIVNSTTLMTDIDVDYYSSWCRVMATPKFSQYCTKHVRKAWKYHLNKLITESNQASQSSVQTINAEDCQRVVGDLKLRLYDLARESDEISFLRKLTEFLSISDPISTSFISHFRENYTKNLNCWALCYRTNIDVDINTLVKTFRRLFKYEIAKGKDIQTFSAGLYCIAAYIKYRKAKDRIKDNTQPTVTKKLRVLRKRHFDAEKYAEKRPFSVEYDADNEMWQVICFHEESDGVIELYSIQENEIKQCSSDSKSCGLFCESCNTCAHQYWCSCHDSAISHNMCKHIHILSLFRRSEKNMKQEAGASALSETIVENVSETVEFSPVFVPVESGDDQENNAKSELENFHKIIERDFQEALEVVKSCITLEDAELWHKIRRQYLRPMKLALERISR